MKLLKNRFFEDSAKLTYIIVVNMKISCYALYTLLRDETNGNKYSCSDTQKHRLIAPLLQVQLLTYLVFRLYVRPSVQQHSSDLCAAEIRGEVKRSPTTLIERRGEDRARQSIKIKAFFKAQARLTVEVSPRPKKKRSGGEAHVHPY